MKYRYTKYTGDELDDLDLEDLVAKLSDLLLSSGFGNPYATDEEDRTLQKAESYAYHAENVAKTPELYQPETLHRILSGAKVSAVDYMQRRRELEQARRGIHEIFATVDLIVTPTIPMPAPSIKELRTNPDALRPAELKLLRNTRPFNVWGLPTISVACGFTHAGLPIGLQIAGPPWQPSRVWNCAGIILSGRADIKSARG